MLWCALPARPGTRPLFRYSVFMFAMVATITSSSDRSMCWPWPVLPTCSSAAMIAAAPWMPVNRSLIAMPAFCGVLVGKSSSRSPVSDMKPDSPCTMKS